MNIISTSVKRPITVTMFYVSVFFIGLYFLTKIPLGLTPNTELPKLTVSTYCSNASPVTVEALVTSRIEAVANTVKGVTKVSSTSTETNSNVEIEFLRDTNMDFAALELNEKLSIVKDELPPWAFQPQIQKHIPQEIGARETTRFMWYTLTGDFSLYEIRQYALNRLRIPLMGVEGVSDVEVYGGRDREIRIEVNRQKAEMLGVSDYSISSALQDLDIKKESGRLYQTGLSYDIFVRNQINNIEEIAELVVDIKEGHFIRLRDLATVEDTYGEPRDYSRINGNPSINIVIKREAGTNTIQVADRVFERVGELKKDFPKSMKLILDYDESKEIRKEIRNLSSRAFFCIITIFVVLLIFLRSFKVPIIILSTIFFSELLAIILFYFAGIGLNLITLAGLALGFGMLVDNSIVVIDNIYRYKEKGETLFLSAEKGTKEVTLPIVASTLTTAVVFLPFLYMTGENRILYVPLAFAVAFSLLSSLIVAFTFIPSVSCRLLASKTSDRIRKDKNVVMEFLVKVYSGFIRIVLNHRLATVFCAVLIFAGSYYLFDKYVTKGRIWGFGSQDETYVRVWVRLPSGADLERCDMVVRMFEDQILENPGYEKVTTRVMSESGSIMVEFPDSIKYTAVPLILYDKLTAYAAQFAGASVSVYGAGQVFSAGGIGGSMANFRLNVYGYNFEEVRKIAEAIGRSLERNSRVRNVETSNSGWYFRDKLYESVLKIKRDKIAEYDLSIMEVLWELRKYLRGTLQSQKLKIRGEEIDYSLKVKGFEDYQLSDLEKVLIRTNSNELVRLSEISEVVEQRVMSNISRENQRYNRTISFEYRGPHKMGERLIDGVIENTHLPEGYSLDKGDSYFMTREEEKEIYLVIAFAILLVYMVTAGLYESLIHPLVILLTVPMALIGMFLIFFFMDKNFDSNAYIGVILLAGIVVNNSIILVDHINLLRKRGMNIHDAVVQGCLNRVRPILMTTTTTIMGLLPLILFTSQTGGGNSIWYSLSIATIGGLLTSTPLTLSVIPALYVLLEEVKYKTRKSLVS